MASEPADGPLDRARAALAAARDLDPGDVQYQDLLVIAQVQAQIAQAAALERIADVLDGVARRDGRLRLRAEVQTVGRH